MPITKRTIVIIVLVVCCAVVLAALYMFYFQFQQKNLPAGQQNAPSEEPATAPSTTQQ
jgi:flagellar basal body-associated protein FliL